ncbi:MAG: hypothetical protein ACYCQI_01115 [Gammaproteobacteria bacterium]
MLVRQPKTVIFHDEIKEAKEPQGILEELMPACIHSGYKETFKILSDYFGDLNNIQLTSSTNFEPSNNRYTLFGKSIQSYCDEVYQKAIAIAINYVCTGAPLDLLEAEIRKDPRVLLPILEIDGMKGTLEQLAIIGLDYTLNKFSGAQEEGLFERLKNLRKELLLGTIPEALQQYQQASPLADKKEKNLIENIANTVFDMIKAKKSLKEVDEYLGKNLVKPKVITDNRYNLFLLKLLKKVIKVFQIRLVEITDWSDRNDSNRGAISMCISAIGIIQIPTPLRVRQLFRGGLYYLLNDNRNNYSDGHKVNRELNQSQIDLYREGIGTIFCYADYGRHRWSRKGKGPYLGDYSFVEGYIEQCIRQSKIIRTQSMDKTCCLVM